MRLIIAGDLHWRGANPRARTDHFQEALSTKLREVFSLAKEYDCEVIVIPGDLMDSPGASYSTVGDLADVLRKVPCRLLAVPGNHDIWGANPETASRTPFGLFSRLDFVHDLSRVPYRGMDDTIITGRSYDAETDRGPESYLIPNAPPYDGLRKTKAIKIHVAHGMALEHPPGFELRHTLLSDIATHSDAPDVLIVGHEHIGFGMKYLPRAAGGEMLAINPGALCRLSAHPAEIERQVQVALLELGPNGVVDARLIPLQSARPGHEVLSREHLEAQAEREERMNRFLALLVEEGESRFLEVREIVEDLARREKLPEVVVREALRRIGQAREELGAGVAA